MAMRNHRENAAAVWSAVLRFGAWWISELRSMLPVTWRGRAEAHLEARVGETAIRITTSGSDLSAPVEFPLDGSAPCAETPLPPYAMALPVWLIPPPHAVLSRVIQIPRSAVARFDTLLQAEADRWTPFPASEMIYGWSAPVALDEKRVQIELRFVAKTTAANWARVLEARGLAPSQIILGPGERLNIRWQNILSPQGRRLRRRKLLIGATVGAALAAVGADWFAAMHEQGIWRQRVTTERAALGRQREMETRIANLLAVQSAAIPHAALRSVLFAEIAAALPASDWLTELSIRQEAMLLRGYSTSVEALLKSLEPLARDRIVTVQGELTFDARLERHRFAVTLRTKGAAP